MPYMQRSNLRQVNCKPKIIKPSFKLGLRGKADQPVKVKPIARLNAQLAQKLKIKINFNTIGATRLKKEPGDLHSDEEGTAAKFNY